VPVTVDAWLLFCATEAVLSFTPGPAVLLVVSLGLSRGGRAGVAASLGILTANAMYFALSATALGAVLQASWQLFVVVKWLGAAYLIWLGARMIFSRARRPDSAAQPELGRGARTRPFWLGFVTQGANPKALLFFTAILPQFIDPRGAVGLQILVLGVSSVVIELVALTAYAAVASAANTWTHRPRVGLTLQRVGGAMLVGAGVQLASMRRS
jgi:homoserine/homoserine lactone efflux protein